MTGENPQSPSPPAITPPSAAAPAVPPVAAAPVSAPESPAAPVAEAPKAEVKAEAPKAEAPADTSLLGAEPEAKPEAAKDAPPADAPKEPKTEAKSEAQPGEQNKESSQSEQAPLPTYELKLPEGVTLDEAKFGEFTKEMGEFQNLTKADHAAVQAFGQKLVDRHVAEVQQTAQRVTEYYQNAFEKQKSDWKAAVEKDPVLGGNRIKTVMNDIANTIASVSTKEQHQAFREIVTQTGIGNNPAVAHVMNNMAAEINRLRTKYESENGVKSLPATAPKGQPQGKVAKRYGGNT